MTAAPAVAGAAGFALQSTLRSRPLASLSQVSSRPRRTVTVVVATRSRGTPREHLDGQLQLHGLASLSLYELLAVLGSMKGTSTWQVMSYQNWVRSTLMLVLNGVV